MLDASIHTYLTQLSLFKRITAIEAIEQGSSKPAYKLVADGHYYFVKDFAHAHAELTRERELQTLLSQQQFSPKLYYSDKRIIVSDFLRANSLSQHSSAIKNTLTVAVNLMARLHRIDYGALTAVSQLQPEQLINDLSASIEQQRIKLNRQQQRSLDWCRNNILSELESASRQKDMVLCHGDVNFSNVLVNSQRSYLIDFECACIAPIEYDLAMLIAINGLSPDLAIELTLLYQELAIERHIVNPDLVTRYLFLCYLINGLWCLSANNKLPVDSQRASAEQQFNALSGLISCHTGRR